MSASDDDGLLLNFSAVGPVAAKPVQSVKPIKSARPQPEKRKTSYNEDSKQRNSASTMKKSKMEKNDKTSMKKIIELEGRQLNNDSENNDDNRNKKSKNDIIDSNTFVSSLFSSNISAQNITKGKLQFKKLTASNDPNTKQGSVDSFDQLNLNSTLINHLTKKLKFMNPTLIQSLVVPQLLKQSTVKFSADLFIQAQTGSGKTLSFALPIINQLMNPDLDINRTSGLFAIILAPSRELATQIYQVFEQLCQCCVRIVPGIVIGGEKKKSEKARLRKGVNVLVSTPGRLLDHLNSTKNLKEQLGLIRWLVLDEGDRLMELGFEQTLTEIIKKLESSAVYNNSSIHPSRTKFFDLLPNRRINVLCSATIKSNVEKLGYISLKKPILISVDSNKENSNTKDIVTSVPDQLVQQIMVVPPKLRLVSLQGLLKLITLSNIKKSENVPDTTRTIVFFSCGDSVDFHFDVFTRDGTPIVSTKPEAAPKWNQKKTNISDTGVSTGKFLVTVNSAVTSPLINPNTIIYKLHGTMPQHIRTSTLKSFINSTEKNCILFCTDVASRGLDLPQISNIIEYDPAFSIDDHLHRVGRTARAGKRGSAALFLLPGDEEGYVDELKKYHHSGFKMVNNEEDILKKAFGELDESNKKWDVLVTTWHLTVERWLLEDPMELIKAEKAFSSHIRAYATHLNVERKYFNIRGLHLGHLAKSFGLRDPPKKLGGKYGSGGKKEDSKKVKKLKKNSKLQMDNDNDDMRKKMLKLAEMAVQKSQNSEFNFA